MVVTKSSCFIGVMPVATLPVTVVLMVPTNESSSYVYNSMRDVLDCAYEHVIYAQYTHTSSVSASIISYNL